LDALHPLLQPVQEKPGRGLADAALPVANLHIERSGRSEAKRVGVLHDGADQQPAALAKTNRSQRLLLALLVRGHGPFNLAVANDFQGANPIAPAQLALDFSLQLLSLWSAEHVAGQLAIDRYVQERSIGDER